jgi:hypothetical protein
LTRPLCRNKTHPDRSLHRPISLRRIPPDVEAVLARCAGVAEAAVFAIPRSDIRGTRGRRLARRRAGCR